MEKFSSKLIEFFVSNDLIKNEDKEIYKYAVNIILSSLIHIATVMIIGLCFNLFIESLVFYFSFIAIRKFAGGYHAKTPVRCYLFSFASNIIILCLVKWLSSINTLFIFIFIIFHFCHMKSYNISNIFFIIFIYYMFRFISQYRKYINKRTYYN